MVPVWTPARISQDKEGWEGQKWIEAEGHRDIVVKLVTIDVVCRKGIKVFRKQTYHLKQEVNDQNLYYKAECSEESVS